MSLYHQCLISFCVLFLLFSPATYLTLIIIKVWVWGKNAKKLFASHLKEASGCCVTSIVFLTHQAPADRWSLVSHMVSIRKTKTGCYNVK